MKSMRYPFILALASVVIAIYFSVGPMTIFLFSKFSGLAVSYKGIEKFSIDKIVIKEAKVFHKKSGVGLSSEKIIIKPDFGFRNFLVMSAWVDLYDAKFTARGGKSQADYSDLSSLISIPLNGGWKYKHISGRFTPFKNSIRIENLNAESDDIILNFTGQISGTEIMHSTMKISFSPKIMGKIPSELSSVVLSSEKTGWKSLSVTLNGDYSSPSIQISSNLFRLSIKSMTESS